MFTYRTSRIRRNAQFALLALACLALLALLVRTVWHGLAQRGGSVPLRTAHTIPNTDLNPYGANFFLAREVEPWKIDKTLQMASEAGIGWVKQQFPWEDIEPLRKGEYIEPATKKDAWAKYDHIVDMCDKYDLRIIARLDRPPDWSRQDNTYQERPPDNLQDFGDFVYTFCARYRGRIDYIQIWNEPNIFPEWGNRAVDPEGYVALLKVAYQRAKEANPNVYVLCAPLAITLGQPHPEPGRWISMSDLDYLEAMYQAGAADYFDIYSANAFGMDLPPDDPASPEALNFQRVLLQREIMEQHDDANKPVWFNEFGWNAAPESMAPEQLLWKRVSEEDQARYTLQGIELAQREWPWAGVFNIWYFRQVGSIGADRADYYFRMVDADFTPRRLYLAVQDVAGQPSSYGSGRYEETSLNVKTFGVWRNLVSAQASCGALFTADQVGDSITFVFEGSAVDLITRRGPDAGRFSVSLDGATLPAPGSDTGLIDLYAPTEEHQQRLPLVRDASAGQHTLRLTIVDSRHASSTGSLCPVDALEVLAQQDQVFPWLAALGYVLGLGLGCYLLFRTWRHLRGTGPR